MLCLKAAAEKSQPQIRTISEKLSVVFSEVFPHPHPQHHFKDHTLNSNNVQSKY